VRVQRVLEEAGVITKDVLEEHAMSAFQPRHNGCIILGYWLLFTI